jgi:hypothetical protein
MTGPKTLQDARNAFHGDPGKGEMLPVVPPFVTYYKGRRINATSFTRRLRLHFSLL